MRGSRSHYVRHLLASTAFLALIYGAEPASAQMPPSYSWTGPYVGANLGLSQATQSSHNYANFPGYGTSDEGKFDVTSDGFLGGIQGGFNWQFPGTPWVAGVEADFDFASNSHTGSNHSAACQCGFQKQKMSELGTLRFRGGYAWDRVLFYGTAGLALGHVTDSFNLFNSADPTFNGSKSGWKLGWAGGGGMEFAITRQISLKVEALYVDLGTRDVHGASNGYDGCTCGFKAHDTAFIGRTGLNFHF
jgi:outer membrane immunogenic protein